MKKRAYLAVLAVCIALTGSACGPESPTSGSSSNGENTGKNITTTSIASEPKGFGTRLVSVENVEKYISLADYKGLGGVNIQSNNNTILTALSKFFYFKHIAFCTDMA